MVGYSYLKNLSRNGPILIYSKIYPSNHNVRLAILVIGLSVFLYIRTILDFLLALLHITSFTANSARNNKIDCKVLGALFQFVLFSSSGWHLVLIVELILLIRNPFR